MNKEHSAIFQCSKCRKTLSSQYNLQRHRNKKIPCDLDKNNHICDRCKKNFTTNQSLQKHIHKKKLCSIKESEALQIEKEKTKQEEIKLRQEEIKLKRVVKESINLKHKSVTNINLSMNILNYCNNLEILPFKNSNSHITEDEVVDILRSKSQEEAAEKIIRIQYTNDRKPENRNIIYPNMGTDDILLLSDNNIWKIESFKENKNKIENLAFNATTQAYILYRNKIQEILSEIPIQDRDKLIYHINTPNISEPNLKSLLNKNIFILENAISSSLE